MAANGNDYSFGINTDLRIDPNSIPYTVLPTYIQSNFEYNHNIATVQLLWFLSAAERFI